MIKVFVGCMSTQPVFFDSIPFPSWLTLSSDVAHSDFIWRKCGVKLIEKEWWKPSKAKGINFNVLLGGSDEDYEGTWKWSSDGAVFTQRAPDAARIPDPMYTNWLSGSSDELRRPEPEKNCLRMDKEGAWITSRCKLRSHVMCEAQLVRGTLHYDWFIGCELLWFVDNVSPILHYSWGFLECRGFSFSWAPWHKVIMDLIFEKWLLCFISNNCYYRIWNSCNKPIKKQSRWNWKPLPFLR